MIAMRHEEHPAAKIFPMLDADAFEQLKEDIRKHGQRDLVVLFGGQILDGRNRYKACCELGIEPDVCELEECDDPVAYVISTNLHRRHLTKAQWAAIAVEYIPMLAEQAAERMKEGGKKGAHTAEKSLGKKLPRDSDEGKAAEQAAKLTNTNRTYVATAKKLKDEAPEVFEEMKSGKLTVPQAVRKAKGEPEPTGERKKATVRREPKANGININEIGERRHAVRSVVIEQTDGQPAYVRLNIRDLLLELADELKS